MASIVKDPGGKKRLQYTDPTSGKKSTIRLGKLEVRQAETVRTKVESLLSASITGSLDAETSKWVAAIDDRLHRKLAAKGLVPPRSRSSHTLGALLDEYFRSVEVKPSTAVTYKQTRRSLEDHFGAGKPLKLITPLEADRWRQVLREEGLAEATVSKRVKTARQVFKQGVRWKMVAENPFQDVRAGAQTNKARMCYIPREVIERVLDACPDREWRLIIALSRYGGLRCPSEHLALRWGDIDWDAGKIVVRSPKTEGMEGREFRLVPLFPELRPYLQEQFDEAAPGTEHVITRARSSSTNLRTGLLRILARAGVSPWPKLFHNLRASRQTELVETFPLHVVCAWLGNTPAIAQGHYLQVHDAHFERAAGGSDAGVGGSAAGVAPAKATQKATPHAAEWRRTEPQIESRGLA